VRRGNPHSQIEAEEMLDNQKEYILARVAHWDIRKDCI
jgi:hypothetical protein